MKNKQKGIITLIAGGLSLAIVIAVYWFGAKSSERIPRPGDARYSMAELAVDVKVAARLDKYEKGLLNMMQTEDPSAGALDFSAFGDPFGSESGTQFTELEGYWDGGFSHVVSMTYISDTMRFAEIDHTFYSEGDKLPDGVLISAISKDGVTMEQNEAVRRVKVGIETYMDDSAGTGELGKEVMPDSKGVGMVSPGSSDSLVEPVKQSSKADTQKSSKFSFDDAQKKLDEARKKAATIPNNEMLLRQLDLAQKSLDAARQRMGR